MAEPAIKNMTVAEFLHWDDGTDTRYELLDGTVLAIAPPAPAHGFLAARLCARIEAALRSCPPCMVQIEAGITKPDSEPLIVVDILSPRRCEGVERQSGIFSATPPYMC
jgi:Uma2 family endonuclease